MGVVVMTSRGVSQPGEARQALTLRQHVGSDARLAGSERMDQQIALQLGDARPVLHVPVSFRRIDAVVLGRQARDRALQIADRRQMLIEARLVFLAEHVSERLPASSLNRVENAALAR